MAALPTNHLSADADQIEAFLAQSVQEGIHLVSIIPDGATDGRWFGDDAHAAAEWAAGENMRGRGLYWTVNYTTPNYNRKPTKDHILGTRFVHVDVDPPKDGSAWDKSALGQQLADLPVIPSFVIDSGNGLQAFWRLSDAEHQSKFTVEMMNKRACATFKGDNCWNIDRLMRLPGTVNWPNRKKIAAGRQPAVVTMWAEDDGIAYPFHALSTSAGQFVSTHEAEQGNRPDVGAGPFELVTADDLDLTTLSPVRSAIDHPPGRDNSGDALAAARVMRNAGFSDEQILGILLNPANAVSAHILNQRDPNRAARRCLEVIHTDQPTEARSASAPPAANDTAPPRTVRTVVQATPYVWKESATIPRRPWLFGRQIMRGQVGGKFAPGAAGKTTHEIARCLSMATGRSFLGHPVWDGPKRVWLWNLEDSMDELQRTIQATCTHWGITEAEIGGRLYVDSALDGAMLTLATQTAINGVVINEPLVAALIDEITARQIDYLSVDPFISSHSVEENDNSAIDAVVKKWAYIAKTTNCAISLTHHVRKTGSVEVSSMDARGASSLVAAVRSALVLNRMSKEEAEGFGIEGEERRRYFRVYDDKNNRAPPADSSEWFKLVSVDLGNGGLDGLAPGDSIGVVEPWSPTDVFDDVSAHDLLEVQKMVHQKGDVRENSQASRWIGRLIAHVLDLDPDKKQDRVRIGKILRTWLANGALKIEIKSDNKGNDRKFVTVGTWAEPGSPPRNSNVGKGGEGGGRPPFPTTPTSTFKVGGGVGKPGVSSPQQNGVGVEDPAGDPDDDPDDPANIILSKPRTVF